jgi:hypothetical protein
VGSHSLLNSKIFQLCARFELSRSHTGCAPLPAHVLPDLSRYLIGTLRPFSELVPRVRCQSLWSSARKLSFQLISLTIENTANVLTKF